MGDRPSGVQVILIPLAFSSAESVCGLQMSALVCHSRVVRPRFPARFSAARPRWSRWEFFNFAKWMIPACLIISLLSGPWAWLKCRYALAAGVGVIQTHQDRVCRGIKIPLPIYGSSQCIGKILPCLTLPLKAALVFPPGRYAGIRHHFRGRYGF